MAEIVACPNCQRKLQVPENFFGQTVQCPECQHQFVANPSASAVQSTPPSSAPASASSTPPPVPDRPAPWDKPAPEPADVVEDELPRRRRRYEDDEDKREDFPSTRRRQDPHRATVVLVLGILAICCIGTPITGTIAWVLGHSDLNAMRRGTMDASGMGQTRTGKNLGMTAVLLWLIVIVGYCLLAIIFGIVGAGNQPRQF